MKKHYHTGVVLCLLFFVLIKVSGQEQTKVREQIARGNSSKVEKPEVKPEENSAESFIEAKKEYSEILPDNSYLVEIANNIEAGNLHTMTSCTSFRKPTKDLVCSITQETAFDGGKQMVSYTTPLSFLDSNSVSGLGDATLTYRYQLTNDTHWAVVSPRVSVIIPTGKTDKGLGLGSAGVQFNLPVTKRLSNAFLGNFNAGMTFFPKMKGEDSSGNPVKRNLASYNLGGSLIWVAHRNFNPLIEYVHNFTGEIGENGRVQRFNEHIVSPGVGLAWEIKGIKVSPGFAVPVNFSRGETRTGIFFYLGIDHKLFKFGKSSK